MLKKNFRNIIFFTFSIFLIYLQINLDAFPGRDLEHPLGFWAWYDQSQYLKQSKDFLNLNFKEILNWVYPPGFVLISFPLSFVTGPENGLIIFSLISLCLFLWSIKENFSTLRYLLLLIVLGFLLQKFRIFAYAFLIPWSTSVSLFFASISFKYLKLINISKLTLNKNITLLSWLILLLITRVQDFLIATVLIGSLLFKRNSFKIIKSHESIIIYVACLIFIIYFFVGSIYLNNLYSNSPHTFLVGDFIYKFIGIFNGDNIYGIVGEPIKDYSIIIYCVFLYSLTYFFFNACLSYSLPLALYFFIYCSFSDFGQHNVIQYAVFHYFKIPFLITFSYFIATITLRKKIIIPFIIFVILALTRITYIANGETCELKIDNKEIYGQCQIKSAKFLEIENIDISYPSVIFQQYKLIINNEELNLFKEFRIFKSKNGVYINLFKPKNIETFNLKLIEGEALKSKMIMKNLNRNIKI